MLNVYRYHVSPTKLDGFEQQWRVDPMVAVEKLKETPGDKEVQKVVMLDQWAILRYVTETGREFPEGLAAILSNQHGVCRKLIEYAVGVGHRVRDIEDRLLREEDVPQIYQYIKLIIKGVWKVAEPIIGQSDYHRAEYVRNILGGDWSKFDRGQYNGSEGWVVLMQKLISRIGDMTYENWPTGKGFTIFKGEKEIGLVWMLVNGKVEILDMNQRLLGTTDPAQAEEIIWQDVKTMMSQLTGE